jgi:hypothetical protein
MFIDLLAITVLGVPKHNSFIPLTKLSLVEFTYLPNGSKH